MDTQSSNNDVVVSDIERAKLHATKYCEGFGLSIDRENEFITVDGKQFAVSPKKVGHMCMPIVLDEIDQTAWTAESIAEALAKLSVAIMTFDWPEDFEKERELSYFAEDLRTCAERFEWHIEHGDWEFVQTTHQYISLLRDFFATLEPKECFESLLALVGTLMEHLSVFVEGGLGNVAIRCHLSTGVVALPEDAKKFQASMERGLYLLRNSFPGVIMSPSFVTMNAVCCRLGRVLQTTELPTLCLPSMPENATPFPDLELLKGTADILVEFTRRSVDEAFIEIADEIEDAVFDLTNNDVHKMLSFRENGDCKALLEALDKLDLEIESQQREHGVYPWDLPLIEASKSCRKLLSALQSWEPTESPLVALVIVIPVIGKIGNGTRVLELTTRINQLVKVLTRRALIDTARKYNWCCDTSSPKILLYRPTLESPQEIFLTTEYDDTLWFDEFPELENT